jgi:hypothetical protein
MDELRTEMTAKIEIAANDALRTEMKQKECAWK